MKLSDVIVAGGILAALGLFTLVPEQSVTMKLFSQNHSFVMSFFKFAVLCTLGELVAVRITSGRYYRPCFGLAPKFIVWGLIGIVIHTAFCIYAAGTPYLLTELGFSLQVGAVAQESFPARLGLAFSISLLNNILFAPLFMTAHAVVSTHIEKSGGTLAGVCKPLNVSAILHEIDWNMLWGFVFKKTIPFFWIPAHTITFLLPPEFRVLFAAALGVVLGIILALASLKSAKTVAV